MYNGNYRKQEIKPPSAELYSFSFTPKRLAHIPSCSDGSPLWRPLFGVGAGRGALALRHPHPLGKCSSICNSGNDTISSPIVVSNFRQPPYCFPMVVTPFAFPRQDTQVPVSPQTHQHLLSGFSFSRGPCEEYPLVVLICVSVFGMSASFHTLAIWMPCV
jgi:hypothetical protein